MALKPHTFVFAAIVPLLVSGGACMAQSTAQTDYELRNVKVIERIGNEVPRELSFIDDNKNSVSLGQYFKPGRPVLITLNYADCPQLCSLQLQDVAKAFRDMNWTAGDEFVALTVSIDPEETFEDAKRFKLRHLGITGKAEVDKGWHFLTTDREQDIRTLASELGYEYDFDPDTGEYLHKAALFIANGDGVISHYLRNMAYTPDELEGKLKASAEGRMGEPSADESGFGLNCFTQEYTDNMGRTFNMMRLGGVGILVFLFSFVGYWWVREVRKPRDGELEGERPDDI